MGPLFGSSSTGRSDHPQTKAALLTRPHRSKINTRARLMKMMLLRNHLSLPAGLGIDRGLLGGALGGCGPDLEDDELGRRVFDGALQLLGVLYVLPVGLEDHVAGFDQTLAIDHAVNENSSHDYAIVFQSYSQTLEQKVHNELHSVHTLYDHTVLE